ncbi:unnamed protein product [Sympodiomycopsis kandeliae]
MITRDGTVPQSTGSLEIASPNNESDSGDRFNGEGHRYTLEAVDLTSPYPDDSAKQSSWEPDTPPLPTISELPTEPSNSNSYSWLSRGGATRSYPVSASSVHGSDNEHSSSPSQTNVAKGPSLEEDEEEEQSEDELQSSLAPSRSPSLAPSPSLSPTPPPPSPPRKSMFDIQDDDEMQAMYAQLSSIMAQRGATSSTSNDGNADGMGSNDEAGYNSDEDYEAQRARKLLENQALLAKLGLGIQQDGAIVESSKKHSDPEPEARSEESDAEQPNTSRRGKAGKGRRTGARQGRGRGRQSSAATTRDPASKTQQSSRNRNKVKPIKVSEDGTTTSNPVPGTVHDLAYVDIAPINERRKNDYVFVADFLIRAPTPTPGPTPSPSPSPPLKKRRGAAAEERRAGIEARKAAREAHRAARRAEKEEQRAQKRAQREEADAARAERLRNAPPKPRKIKRSKGRHPSSNHSGALETSCHQCRRRTPGLKMACANVGLYLDGTTRHCSLLFCLPCMDIRYGAIEPDVPEEVWDVTSTTWKCPRCRAICNCSICLQKAGLDDFIPKGNEQKLRNTSLSNVIKGKDGSLDYLSVRHYLEAQGIHQIGKPGVGAGTVSEDDEEGLLMAKIAQLKGQMADKLGVPRELPPRRPVGSENESQGESSQSEDDDQSAAVKPFPNIKRIILKLPEEGRQNGTAPSQNGQTPKRGGRAAKASKSSSDANKGKFGGKSTAVNSASDPAATQSRRASKKTAESEAHVWVQGPADLSDSESDLSQPDEETTVEQSTGTRQRRGTSEESSLTSLSDWSHSSLPTFGPVTFTSNQTTAEDDVHESHDSALEGHKPAMPNSLSHSPVVNEPPLARLELQPPESSSSSSSQHSNSIPQFAYPQKSQLYNTTTTTTSSPPPLIENKSVWRNGGDHSLMDIIPEEPISTSTSSTWKQDQVQSTIDENLYLNTGDEL